MVKIFKNEIELHLSALLESVARKHFMNRRGGGGEKFLKLGFAPCTFSCHLIWTGGVAPSAWRFGGFTTKILHF